MKKLVVILSKRKIKIWLTALFGFFMLVVLPVVSMVSDSASPDTMFFYSSGRFYDLMESYGQSGRNLYIILRWTFDLVYPLVYGLFFMMIMIALNSKIKFLFFPILGVIFDYLENTVATINVGIYPKEVDFLVYLMQVFSLMKWLSLLITVALIIYLLMNRLRSYRHDSRI